MYGGGGPLAEMKNGDSEPRKRWRWGDKSRHGTQRAKGSLYLDLPLHAALLARP